MADSINIPNWVKELTTDNFLSLYDVALDIKQEMQVSDDPVIPIWQPILKFSRLMPIDSINMRDRYGDLRWKATGLLKARKIIGGYQLLPGTHRWKSRLRIMVDRRPFNAFVKMLEKEHGHRIQGLKEARKANPQQEPSGSLEIIQALLQRFHAVAIQLRQRRDGRPTLDVNDEYDVQDLLHALLCLHFDDIRPEEWTPSYAGKSSRVDFLLKFEETVVEVKKTRPGLTEKQIGDQLIIDIARYSKMTGCKALVCFIYDPENRILNPGGLESDLSGKREGMIVEVLVLPKRY